MPVGYCVCVRACVRLSSVHCLAKIHPILLYREYLPAVIHVLLLKLLNYHLLTSVGYFEVDLSVPFLNSNWLYINKRIKPKYVIVNDIGISIFSLTKNIRICALSLLC